MQFESLILGTFPRDELIEIYERAWEIYHDTADSIDGHIKAPVVREHYQLVASAGKQGRAAQVRYLNSVGTCIPDRRTGDWKKWQAANQSVLRRRK